jgi:UDP-3-O-[3-hydroxymyristoyl] N-acetylglucosamine deacetylase
MNQITLAKPVKISGVGLHTGVEVNLKLKPAPENTGYIFVRTDLDNFEIPASVEYISHCSYATTLMRRGVVLSTCDALLSALRGSGVDNCFIEIDNIEIPIMDGSSEDFVELIKKTGVVEQESPRRTFRVLKKIEFRARRQKNVSRAVKQIRDRVPDRFSASFINRQSYHFVFANGSFGEQIASAKNVWVHPRRSKCSAKQSGAGRAHSTMPSC